MCRTHQHKSPLKIFIRNLSLKMSQVLDTRYLKPERANVKFVVGAALADGEAPQMPLFDDTYRMGMQIVF